MKPSEILSFNKTLFKNCLYRYWWWTLLSTIFLFLMVAVPVVIDPSLRHWLDVVSNPVILIYSMLGPIVLAILMFRVLHSETAMVYHLGLPIKRMAMTNSYILAGLLMLLLPVLVILVFCALMLGLQGIPLGTSVIAIVAWAIVRLMLIMINIFLIGVLIAHAMGSSLGAFLIAIIIQFVPYVLYSVGTILINALIYGMAVSSRLEGFFMRFMPIPLLIDSLTEVFTTPSWYFWYFLLSIGIYLLIHVASCKRPVEMSKEFIAFPFLRPIFIWSFTLSFTLTFGTGLAFILTDQMLGFAWTTISFVVSAVIGYVISMLLIGERRKILKKLKPLWLFVLVIIVTLSVIKVDLFEFEKRLPVIGEIKEAGIASVIWTNDYDVKYLSDDPQYIRSILKSHAEIIDQRPAGYTDIIIKYAMKDGSELIRKYSIDPAGIDHLAQALSHETTSRNELRIYNFPDNRYIEASVSGVFENAYNVSLTEDEFNTLLNLIKEDETDTQNLTQKYNRLALLQIDYAYSLPNSVVRYDVIVVRNYHAKAIQWMKEHFYIESDVFPYSQIDEIRFSNDGEEYVVTEKDKIKIIIDQSYSDLTNGVDFNVIMKSTGYIMIDGEISEEVYNRLKNE